MIKKITTLMMALAAFGSVNAQNEYRTTSVRPMAGLNIYSLWGDDLAPQSNVGYIVGAEIANRLNPVLGINAGLLFSQSGFDFDVENYRGYVSKVKANIQSINMPLTLNFYLLDNFALQTGLQPSFSLSARFSGDGDSQRMSSWNSFDMAIPLGVSYQIDRFCINMRYNVGLTKEWKGTDMRSHSFVFTLGYDLPISKASK